MNQSMQLTQAMFDQAPSVKAVLEIDNVQRNWVATYHKLSGREDGEQRFEAEKIMFLQLVSKTAALAQCNKFSIYSAFVELAISGLSLRDGLTYIIPRGGVANFMVGWKGRLEQLNEMSTVVFVHEPQVVHAGDVFEYELGANPKIIKHKPAIAADKGSITMVYMVIEYTHGTKCYFMTAEEVLNIRDRRSDSYRNNPKTSMWATDEIQAFKKTIVKRVYNASSKLPKHRMIDDRMSKTLNDDDVDVDDLANSPNPAAQDVNFDEMLNVDTNTGEVHQQQQQSNTQAQSVNSEATDNSKAEEVKNEELKNNESGALEMF